MGRPPRKKRKISTPNDKPGIAVSYINENFSSLPSSLEEVKNGHVRAPQATLLYLSSKTRLSLNTAKTEAETEQIVRRAIPVAAKEDEGIHARTA
jgi:hypothetical protein